MTVDHVSETPTHAFIDWRDYGFTHAEKDLWNSTCATLPARCGNKAESEICLHPSISFEVL